MNPSKAAVEAADWLIHYQAHTRGDLISTIQAAIDAETEDLKRKLDALVEKISSLLACRKIGHSAPACIAARLGALSWSDDGVSESCSLCRVLSALEAAQGGKA